MLPLDRSKYFCEGDIVSTVFYGICREALAWGVAWLVLASDFLKSIFEGGYLMVS